MLTIIHGSDTASSRNYFLEEKKKFATPNSLTGEMIHLTDLSQILEGGELFTTEKSIFIEQFLSKNKKSKERDAIIHFLNHHAVEHAIFLWEGKEIEKTVLNSFKKTVIKNFKMPQTLFAFLDSLHPGNSKQMIELFRATTADTEPEMLFFMLVRQFRLLLALSLSYISGVQSNHEIKKGDYWDTPNSEQDRNISTNIENDFIDELKRLAPWQKTKLINQAKLFCTEKLIALYQNLFQIELAQKTGNLSAPLTSAIDFWLLEI